MVTTIDKAIVSAIMTMLTLLVTLGLDVPEFLNASFVNTAIGVIGTALAAFGVTWLTPNRPQE